MNDIALRLTNVNKTFNVHSAEPVRAVRDLSLTINRGEIVAFLGPNGAGKTTSLDMVLGLTEPTNGTIEVFGGTPAKAIAAGRISAVLQSGGLLADLTVGETVRMIASLYANPLAPEEAMSRAGITKLEKRRVSKCSGGEQQRLRFALALLPEPDLLILDEPTAGMDVNARQEFWKTMRQEARGGRTIIFATHYLQEADEFAERIVMIAAGQLIADGPTAEIRELTGAKTVSVRWPNVTEADLERLPGVSDVVITDDRAEFKTGDADAAARILLTETPATDLEIRSAGLDAAFTALTEKAKEASARATN
ncbi:ABC transporter ATP-binding protein [Gulosibacter macacae]|uniref:ABC transporter ATP-binding protein n=1 Tax=Gulosibacter macacae TaxID=2488791 RepID=A0A3P3W0U1_9MICO|nr:ABC transporter ATP-binding protein [Gulosibacter macacae]RRJ87506.1 ABC transporter ATP-binding protein [Gulosibacter macacae]